MQSEMVDIYSMLKELRNNIMLNGLPLPPRTKYAEIRTSNEINHPASPSNMPPRRKKQNTGEEENHQLQHLTVPELNKPGSKAGPRASSNVATPDEPGRY
jgi:hypothetical protein